MKNIELVIVFIALFSFSMNASAFCSEPSAPFSKPTKPSAPYCVNEWNNTHDCDEWTINNYYSELENYQYEVERYIKELEQYVQSATDYAECEIRNLE